MNSYAKDLDPGAAAQKHREAASDIWNIREAYLSLLTDIRDPAIALEPLRQQRDELQSALHKIYRAALTRTQKLTGKRRPRFSKMKTLRSRTTKLTLFSLCR